MAPKIPGLTGLMNVSNDMSILIKTSVRLVASLVVFTLILFVISFLDKFIADIWNALTIVVKGIAVGVEQVADTGLAVTQTAANTAATVAKTTGSVLGDAVSASIDMLDETVEFTTENVGKAVDGVNKAVTTTSDTATQLATAVGEAGTAIKGLTDSVGEVVRTAVTSMKNLEGTFDTVKQGAKPICQTMDGLAGAINSISIPGIPDEISIPRIDCEFLGPD